MNGNQQEGQFRSLDPYERWPDSALEVWRDSHPDPVQRLLVSEAWSRRTVDRCLRMTEMQDAPDAVIQSLRDHHRNLYVESGLQKNGRSVQQGDTKPLGR